MKKISIFMCVLLLISSTMIAGCGKKDEMADENANNEVLFDEKEVTYTSVKTSYGELKFMEKWKDAMIVEQTEDGENLIVSFKTELQGETYPLFDLVIGQLEEEAVMELKGKDGNMKNLYVHMYEIMPGAELSMDEKNQLYAMQEEINSIISFLE